MDKVDFDDPEDTKEVLEAEGDNFLNPFLQANVWLNTKQIIAKIKRVFLDMSKSKMFWNLSFITSRNSAIKNEFIASAFCTQPNCLVWIKDVEWYSYINHYRKGLKRGADELFLVRRMLENLETNRESRVEKTNTTVVGLLLNIVISDFTFKSSSYSDGSGTGTIYAWWTSLYYL